MSATQAICRMCHRSTGKLVSPCMCEGSMRYIHSKCLSDWVRHCESLSCEVCGATYSVAKVLRPRRIDDGVLGFFVVAWICIQYYGKRYMRRCLHLLFHIAAILFTLFIVATCSYTIDSFISVTIPWHPVSQLLTDMGDEYALFAFLFVGLEVTICMCPFFFLWEAWHAWYDNQEDIFGFFSDEEENGETTVDSRFLDVDEDSSEELSDRASTGSSNNDNSDLCLDRANLPEENASILEAIVSAHLRSNNQSRMFLLLSSHIYFFTVRFILFYLSVVVLLRVIPELVRLATMSLWIFMNGSFYCATAAKMVIELISPSYDSAQIRYAMFISLIDALQSSTLLFWTIACIRRILCVWVYFSLTKRLRFFPHRKVIISTLLYFRGMLKILLVVSYSILAICLLPTVLCLDFFTTDVSFGVNDYNKAWKALGLFTTKVEPRSSLSEYSVMRGSSTSSPVTVFKALHVLSQVEENDICWNFGNLHMNSSYGNISNSATWTVEGDDPLLFPLFALKVFVSKVHTLSLLKTGYVATLLVSFCFRLLWIITATLPAEWLKWSSVYMMLQTSLFELIHFWGVKALLRAYGEIVLFTVITSCFLFRYSFSLIHVIAPGVVPVLLMENTNITFFIYWSRLFIFTSITPQVAFRMPHDRWVSMIGNLFEIKEVMQKRPFFLPHFLSRVVRVTAFVVCYWLFSIVAISTYTIAGLYITGKQHKRALFYMSQGLTEYIALRFVLSRLIQNMDFFLNNLAPQFRLFVLHWRLKWWCGSCLGVWLSPRVLSRNDSSFNYVMEPIYGVPDDVCSKFISTKETIYSQLERRKQNVGTTLSIERLQKALRLCFSMDHSTCLLFEEDISLLLEYLSPPSIRGCIYFCLTWMILVLVLPFLAGSTWLFLWRRFFTVPHCFTGPQIMFFLISWLCGIGIMVFTDLRLKQKRKLERLLLYLFCGCHNFTMESIVTFVFIPIFMQVAFASFVPYTLIMLIQRCSHSNYSSSLGPFVGCLAVVMMLSPLKLRFGMSEVMDRLQLQLRDMYGQIGGDVLELGEVRGERTSSVVLNPSVREGSALDTSKETERGSGRTVSRVLDYLMNLHEKTVATIRDCIHAAIKATAQFLKKVVERENVVGVVFVDRTLASKRLEKRMEEEANLRDLMNRLRFAAGKAGDMPSVEVPSACINEKCLLVIQQALCRHPALDVAHKSRDELKKHVMEQLKDSLRAEINPLDEVGRLLGWINETSETLEIERLSAVYHDPSHVLSDIKQKTLDELGIETLPNLSQCNTGDLSPWNVIFNLVIGPLLTFDDTLYRRAEMHFSNPTPAMIEDLMEINRNIYSTTSWISLLNSLGHFPIKAVRHVWLAATFFFPTSGPVVVGYLLREIEEVSRRRRLWDERDEDDAKETFCSYCRILNCFFRHLPLCFSVDLFRLFLDFLESYVKPDNTAMDNIFKIGLQRYIGHCPASTDVWKRYIQWRGDKINDAHQRREWIRKMYIRVLRTPLNGLGEIKEDYDFFLKSEYRGRPPSEGRLEERFVRAKGIAGELNRFMGAFGNTHSGDLLPRSLYLPRPVKLMANNTINIVVTDREEIMRRLEVELWAQWTFLIDREINSSAYTGMELFGYERVRFFFAMRTSFFPHQAFCWINFVDYCLDQQPLLSAPERQVMARDVLEKASFLLVKNFYVQVAYCDYMLRELEEPEYAHRCLRDLLLQQRQLVVDYIKSDTLVKLDGVLSALERIALLSVNWMRWGSLHKDMTNTQYVRLVARFTMHSVDFLSLIMGVIRRASRGEPAFTPRRPLRAFNTFCHFWIKLELIRNQVKMEAVLIFERWKDHLKMFLKSAKGRGWSLTDCGVDEYFISSCADVCRSNPSAAQQILTLADEVRLAAVESDSFSPIEVETLISNIRGLRDMFFVVDDDAKDFSFSTVPLQLFTGRLRGETVPLQTYDHHLFSAKEAWHGDKSLYMSLAEETDKGDGCARNVPFQCSVEVMPDDARWAPYLPTRPPSAAEGSQNGQRTNADHEVKSRKNKRPPNRRVLVAASMVLKDLPSAMHIPKETTPLQKVEKLLTVHLPSTYETDVLFAEKAICTDWLLEFLEQMPATH